MVREILANRYGRGALRLGALFACAAALGCGQDNGSQLVANTGAGPQQQAPGGGMTAPAPTSGAGAEAGTGQPAGASGAEPAAAGTASTAPAEPDGTAGTQGSAEPMLEDAGTSQEPPPASDAATEPPPPMDYGEGDGSDVVTIGDSWMNYIVSGGGIEGALDRAGKNYRGYGVAGTLLLNGQIPRQYDSAKRANPDIKTVIMTGGGNDIMFSGGCATAAACEMSVQALADGLNELWTTMSDDGVKDVVYIRYSQGAGTTNSDNLPKEPPAPPAICLSGPIRCTSMDTTDLVMGQLLDGIHPTPAANDRIAAGLLELLEAKGIRR